MQSADFWGLVDWLTCQRLDGVHKNSVFFIILFKFCAGLTWENVISLTERNGMKIILIFCAFNTFKMRIQRKDNRMENLGLHSPLNALPFICLKNGSFAHDNTIAMFH